MANSWTEICMKCMAGDIEPHYCEYYGEQNGCNSPTCGKHPPTPTTPNAAALREALVQIVALATQDQPRYAIISTAETALAAPPRNCDVGTAKEQDERFRDFCPKFVGGTCTGCELRDCGCAECGFAWAQMPYDEGVSK